MAPTNVSPAAAARRASSMFPGLPHVMSLLLFLVGLRLSAYFLLRYVSLGKYIERGVGGGGPLPIRLSTSILPGGGVPPLTDLKRRLVTTPRQKALGQLSVGAPTVFAGKGGGSGGGGVTWHRLVTTPRQKALGQLSVGATTVFEGKGGGSGGGGVTWHRLATTPRQKALGQLSVGATTVFEGKAGGSGGGGVTWKFVLQEKDIVNPHPFKYLVNPGEAACRTSFINQQKSGGDNRHRTRSQEGRQGDYVTREANTNNGSGSGGGDGGGGHGGGGGDYPVWLLIYVHSAPAYLKKRQSIRQTWGAREVLDSYNASLVFVLGRVENSSLSQLILQESERYGDIVQEDFLDSYRNLTYKAIAGLKWAATFCSGASYILKTDDDILVNLHTLVKHVRGVVAPQYGDKKLITCLVWKNMLIMRDKSSKWYVPESDFPGEFFPPYCSGSAFLLSGDMPRMMYEASMISPFFWVDDYYITGALIKRLNITHRQMDQAYVINTHEVKRRYRTDIEKKLFFFQTDTLSDMYEVWWNMTIAYKAVASA